MGKPIIDLSTPEKEQLYIIDRVDIDPDTNCWLWKQRCTHGYGVVGPGHRLAKKYNNTKLSRLSYNIFVGPIPEGQVVRHKCRSRQCCNPAHLELGTQYENVQDKKRDGTTVKGVDQVSSKLTEQDVKDLRKLFATGRYTKRYLGNLFEISPTVIRRIILGVMWSHIS